VIMQISNKYIVVEKLEEEAKEGFKAVEVQDNFVYKGRVKLLPEIPVYLDNKQLAVGDIVVWAKYSPDTHDFEGDKFISINDLLAVYE